MKRFLLVVLGLLAVPCFAANNIKMVTYFPVPYAAYSDLSVDGTCDVGLLGSCSLDAGAALNVAKKGSDSRALNTGSFIVRSGTLNLQSTNSSPILSTAYLTAGNGSATVGSLNFSHDLAVSQINNSTAQSMTAQNKAILTRLQIFGHTFPTCDATDHKISWQRLTMGGTTGIFLVCGEGAEATCEQNPNQEKCCTAEQEWNGTECVETACPSGQKRQNGTCVDICSSGETYYSSSGSDYCCIDSLISEENVGSTIYQALASNRISVTNRCRPGNEGRTLSLYACSITGACSTCNRLNTPGCYGSTVSFTKANQTVPQFVAARFASIDPFMNFKNSETLLALACNAAVPCPAGQICRNGTCISTSVEVDEPEWTTGNTTITPYWIKRTYQCSCRLAQ